MLLSTTMSDARYRALLDSIEATQHSYRGTFEEVLAVADPLPRGRALDVPCGPGRMAEALSQLATSAWRRAGVSSGEANRVQGAATSGSKWSRNCAMPPSPPAR